jgi:transcriptional/translational regulatory protein YebC/TACO1
MTRNGGNMADPGSVAYLFNRKGVVLVPKTGRSEDDVLMAVLDAGAEAQHNLPAVLVEVATAMDVQAGRLDVVLRHGAGHMDPGDGIARFAGQVPVVESVVM